MVGYSLLYNVDLQLLNYQNEVNTIDNLVVYDIIHYAVYETELSHNGRLQLLTIISQTVLKH